MNDTIIYPEIEALRYLIKEQKAKIEELTVQNARMQEAMLKSIEASSVREWGWQNILPECLASLNTDE